MSKSIRHNETNSIKELIDLFIKENKLTKGLRQITLEEIWKEQMGAGVATYTKKVELRGELFIVYLNSSVLREELSYGKDKIINILNESLGEDIIKRIKLL